MRNVFPKKTFCILGPWDYSPGSILIFAEVSFRVRYGAPQVRSFRKFRVNLYRRTPPGRGYSSTSSGSSNEATCVKKLLSYLGLSYYTGEMSMEKNTWKPRCVDPILQRLRSLQKKQPPWTHERVFFFKHVGSMEAATSLHIKPEYGTPARWCAQFKARGQGGGD